MWLKEGFDVSKMTISLFKLNFLNFFLFIKVILAY